MAAARKIKILFADDHGVVRDGLRALFKSDPGISIVGEARDGEQAVHMTARLRPHIAILDISMPKMNGIEATRIIKRDFPQTKILILTIHEKEEFIYEMIQAGASGYVLKNAEKKEIFAAVRALAAGDTYFSPRVSKLLIESVIKRTIEQQPSKPNGSRQLTSRELEVLRHIAEGRTSREIADALHISFRTVNSHRMNLMQKLDIHDTAGLVRYAIHANLVNLDSRTQNI